jgi:hypothetical protein
LTKYLLIFAAALVWVGGCANSSKAVEASFNARMDTPEGMIGYLEKLRLPALESVQVWENEYGPGLVIRTAHYEIMTTLLDPLMLSEAPGFVESAYRSYQKQLPEPVEMSGRFRMYLFKERGQWENFTRGFTRSQAPLYLKIKAGAYYLNGACVAYNIGRERTFSVLGHEGWHQFNSRHFKFRLPSWLDEGIAMQFEISRYEKGLFYFEPALNGYRLGALKKTLMEDGLIPLRELVSINPGEVVVKSDEAVAAFYAQAYSLVRFLKEDQYGKRLGRYHQLLMDGLNGRWPLNEQGRRIASDRNIPLTIGWNREVGSMLFEQYIEPDFESIETEYVTFCKKIVYNVRLR